MSLLTYTFTLPEQFLPTMFLNQPELRWQEADRELNLYSILAGVRAEQTVKLKVSHG